MWKMTTTRWVVSVFIVLIAALACAFIAKSLGYW
jgi:hypothetical protein